MTVIELIESIGRVGHEAGWEIGDTIELVIDDKGRFRSLKSMAAKDGKLILVLSDG